MLFCNDMQRTMGWYFDPLWYIERAIRWLIDKVTLIHRMCSTYQGWSKDMHLSIRKALFPERKENEQSKKNSLRKIRPWSIRCRHKFILTKLALVRIFTMTVALNAGAIISALNEATVVYFTKVTGKSRIAKTGDWFGAIAIVTETATTNGSPIFTKVTKEAIRTMTFPVFTFTFIPATKTRNRRPMTLNWIAYRIISHESVEQSNPINPGLHSHLATGLFEGLVMVPGGSSMQIPSLWHVTMSHRLNKFYVYVMLIVYVLDMIERKINL